MTRLLCFVVAIMFLYGCDVPRNKYPLPIVNGYYEQPVYHDVTTSYEYDNKKEFSSRKSFGFQFWNGNAPTGVSPYDLGESGFTVQYVEKIDFYQDEARQCFLFSYNNERLRDLKLSTGKALSSSDVIFVIEKDGIIAMPNYEYNKIKSTMKPHPYDRSLCKTKTSDM